MQNSQFRREDKSFRGEKWTQEALEIKEYLFLREVIREVFKEIIF